MQDDDDENDEFSDSSRVKNEILLLEAAYPTDLAYSYTTQELKFTSPATSNNILCVRVPDDYPSISLPIVVSASGPNHVDLRNGMTKVLHTLTPGEEVLDLLISSFQELLASTSVSATSDVDANLTATAVSQQPDTHQTTLIWTHHLLALSKRKLALSPATSVAGVTKPGYPGVMIFSGSASAVKEHVDTLRQQNWQAFQVRLEITEMWTFEHGKGVKEVETMGEVVQSLSEQNKKVFLEAMRMK